MKIIDEPMKSDKDKPQQALPPPAQPLAIVDDRNTSKTASIIISCRRHNCMIHYGELIRIHFFLSMFHTVDLRSKEVLPIIIWWILFLKR